MEEVWYKVNRTIHRQVILVAFVIDAIHFDCVQLQSQPRQDRYTRHTHVHC